jgi:hypothetical protein
LEFGGPSQPPDVGSQGKITLSVHGTAEPVTAEIRNDSPEIVQFPRGRTQRLTTSGGEKNVAVVDLKFLAAGDYTLTARIVAADPIPASSGR